MVIADERETVHPLTLSRVCVAIVLNSEDSSVKERSSLYIYTYLFCVVAWSSFFLNGIANFVGHLMQKQSL